MNRYLMSGIAAALLSTAAHSQDVEWSPSKGGVPVTKGVGSGFPITVIYTNLPGEPSSLVPGLGGVRFDPPLAGAFQRVYGSPNGNWALTAFTDQDTAMNEILLVNGVVEAQEGSAAPFAGGENIGIFDTRVSVNDAGDFVYATNTDGPTTNDEYIVRSAIGTFSAAAREGDGASPPLPAGATWGSILESPVLTNAGVVGFVTDNIGGVASTENEAAVLGNTLLAQKGVTVPTGQVGSEFLENFDLDDFWISADGSSWLLQGDLTGSVVTDDVVVVDGAVVIQEGSILPGSAFANPVDAGGIVAVHMSADGRWFARGNNEVTEQDWVYSNGVVIAQAGDPIFAGAGENWSDAEFAACFFQHVGNSTGDFLIAGVTDAPTEANGVLVLNETTVVVRESDPIDLDGNGLFDDDLYFNTFGNDDVHLTDAGILYVVATIKDGMSTPVGQGFFSINLSTVIAPDDDDDDDGGIAVELGRFTVD